MPNVELGLHALSPLSYTTKKAKPLPLKPNLSGKPPKFPTPKGPKFGAKPGPMKALKKGK